jgi:hypothetical protein
MVFHTLSVTHSLRAPASERVCVCKYIFQHARAHNNNNIKCISLGHSCALTARESFRVGGGCRVRPLRAPGGGCGCVALAAALAAAGLFSRARCARSACSHEVVGPCAVGQRATRQGGCTRIHEREYAESSRNLGQLTRAFASALLCRVSFCARQRGENLASFLTDVVPRVFEEYDF